MKTETQTAPPVSPPEKGRETVPLAGEGDRSGGVRGSSDPRSRPTVGIVMPLAEQRGGAELLLLQLLDANRALGADGGVGCRYAVAFLEDGPMVEAVRALGGERSAVVLANHGPVVTDKDLATAVYAMEELEETAKLAILTRGLNPIPLTAPQIREVVDHFNVECD